MKRLINYSPFQGWKEFHTDHGNFRFERRGNQWEIFKQHGNAYIHEGAMWYKSHESNAAMLKRAVDVLLETYEEDEL